MKGLGRMILHSLHIIWPNALTIDLPSQTIYWADAKLHIIESSDYHGENRRPILMAGVFHPFGMSLFWNRLYWSDWNTLATLSTSKDVSCNLSQIEGRILGQDNQLTWNQSNVQGNLFQPMNFRVVHLVLQLSYPGGNPCGTHSDENGRCLYLCLLSAVDQKGYICACPTGTVLHSNQRDCEVCKNFLGKVRVLAR